LAPNSNNMNTNYPELRSALDAFREVFRRNLLPWSAITLGQTFLQEASKKEVWGPGDAFKIYQIIKPHAPMLKKVDFDFKSVPEITTSTNIKPSTQPQEKQSKMIGYDGTNFIIFFPYHNDLVKAVKLIRGARWWDHKKCWTVPLSEAKQVKQFAMGHDFNIGDMAFSMMNDVEDNLDKSYSSEYIELNLPVKKKFYPFQTVGVDYIMNNKRVIVGDQMGLGKTVQGIGGVVGTESNPYLVIVPKDLRLNWQDEIHAWTDHKAIILNKKNVKQLPFLIRTGMVNAVITNYEGVNTFFIDEIKDVHITTGPNAGLVYKKVYTNGLEALFKAVILDEGHKCRNKRTLRYKCIKKMFEDKEVRIILTGTPVVKGPEDMAALLELLGQIEYFGGYKNFMDKYRQIQKDFVDKKDQANFELRNLNLKLRSRCFIRREKQQVLTDLPEKFRKIVRVDLENRKEYDHAFISIQDWMVTKNLDPRKIDSALRAELLVRINVLKQLSAKGKMTAFQEFVDDVIESGEKLVVFCWFNETVQVLKDRFKEYGAVTICGKIDGHPMADWEIQNNKKKFQDDPNCKLMICTYGKGGVGHTLTAASKWACIELGWTYADQAQAEDRIHRIGQRNACECYYFLGADTFDEDFYRVIDQRRMLEKMSTGGTEDIPVETVGDIAKKILEKIQK
jgi:SWI/SNF-related matrix-associated actin-dependent regulator 1 of chromatin subfamily A